MFLTIAYLALWFSGQFLPGMLKNLCMSKILLAFSRYLNSSMGFPDGSDSKESACNAGDLGQEDVLEKGMATHSGILAWRITDGGPW